MMFHFVARLSRAIRATITVAALLLAGTAALEQEGGAGKIEWVATGLPSIGPPGRMGFTCLRCQA